MSAHNRPEAAVQEIIQSWAAAVHRRDIDGVLRHHADDLLMFDVVGPTQIRGVAAYRKSWEEQFFPWHGVNGQFELRDLQVTADSRVAFATALIECEGKEDGAKARFTIRLTTGLEQRGGEWLIVHEHHSEPVKFEQDEAG